MTRSRLALVASASALTITACLLGAPAAQAQFVCVGNANGAPVLANTADGDGATAAGSVGNTACGPQANASSGSTATPRSAIKPMPAAATPPFPA
jgi:trimeric autotransporter adhesin